MEEESTSPLRDIGQERTQTVSQETPVEPLSTLLCLPFELVLGITELLPAEDGAALSLSCKKLYSLFNLDSFKSLTVAQCDRLLKRLERDLGAVYYFCDRCHRLHPAANVAGPRQHLQGSRGSCLSMSFHNVLTKYWLRYAHGRLVMNRYFYGESVGLPLESLDGPAVNWHPYLGDWRNVPRWETRFKAKIVHGQLFLQGSHVLESTTLDMLWEDVDKAYHWICNHQGTHHGFMRQLCQEATGYYDAPGELLLAEGRGSCTQCMTDYVVAVTTKSSSSSSSSRDGPALSSSSNHHTVRVFSYHLAGSFRSSRDLHWQALCGLVRAERDWIWYYPGFVARQWFSAERRVSRAGFS